MAISKQHYVLTPCFDTEFNILTFYPGATVYRSLVEYFGRKNVFERRIADHLRPFWQ